MLRLPQAKISELKSKEGQQWLSPKRRRSQFSSLGAKYFFAPVACESLGVLGAETLSFLGHHLHQTTGNPQPYQLLLQPLFVAIQREGIQHPSWEHKVLLMV